MKVREAAARLEVSAATVYSLIATGRLKCARVGVGRGVIRISEEHLAEYLRAAEPRVEQQPSAPVTVPRLKHLRLS